MPTITATTAAKPKTTSKPRSRAKPVAVPVTRTDSDALIDVALLFIGPVAFAVYCCVARLGAACSEQRLLDLSGVSRVDLIRALLTLSAYGLVTRTPEAEEAGLMAYTAVPVKLSALAPLLPAESDA